MNLPALPPQTAGFDPIFFLHHANVDRLVALWQAFNPQTWVSPGVSMGTFMYNAGQPIDSSSPLYPFLGPAPRFEEQRFLTASDVMDTQALGYTYDDFLIAPTSEQLYERMITLYGPEDQAFRWYLFANCSVVNNPNITMGWQISIDPTFDSGTAGGRRLAGGRRRLASPHRRMLSGRGDDEMEELVLNSTLEVSLGRTVVPSLMQFHPHLAGDREHLFKKEGNEEEGNEEDVVVSSQTSVDITNFLRAKGVTGLNPAPLNPDDLSLGPSAFPFAAAEVGSRCQNYYSGSPLACTCKTQVSWVIAEQGAFVNYKGPVP